MSGRLPWYNCMRLIITTRRVSEGLTTEPHGPSLTRRDCQRAPLIRREMQPSK
ncbi:hypothetical protein RISK_003705 [Rhodopirellula islandica]|uniref:Uncharacterized protein n=1 Tax=Rhodopirellula islandica TaxID=595434 RepID=A0A0J1EF17_RHOIS|nr:hypothetical protein RISK_003705 [Rhodopirellula islandica]